MSDNTKYTEKLQVPDLSLRTVELVSKEVSNLDSKISTRLDGMEKAVEIFHADLTRVPTAVDRAIQSLREIVETRLNCLEEDRDAIHHAIEIRGKVISEAITHLRELLTSEISKLKVVTDEVFERIDVQFVERDKRTEQLALASSTAIAAALQAAKEAVGAQNTSNSIAIAKSESSTLESLRQLRELFLSDSRATNDKINDLKSRLDKGEGQHTGIGTSWGVFLGAGSILISLVMLLLVLSKSIT